MSFIKGFIAAIIGLLLFVVLLLISLAFFLDRTLLNRDFAVGELERSDAVGLATETVLKNLPQESRPYAPAVASSLEELRPWFLQQARDAINAGYDFLFGRSERFQLAIQTDPVRQSLLRHLRQFVRDNPPPEIRNLAPADRERATADFERDLPNRVQFNPVYRIDADSLSADARDALVRVREALGHFRMAYNLAIGAAVVLALCLVLLRRSTLSLGIVLLVVSAVDFGAWALARAIPASIPPDQAIPEGLRAYLPQLIEHLMEPVWQFGVYAGVAGLVAIVVAIAVGLNRKASGSQATA